MSASASASAPAYGLSERLRDLRENVAVSPRARRAAAVAGLCIFGAICGTAIALAGLAGALILVSAIACVACVRDFRVGVILLIIMMPISASYMFPHAMFGITGLNPLNLLLAATLGSFMLRYLGTKADAPFIPRKLLWLYILPLVMGGLLGMEHVKEIPRHFKADDMIFFDEPFGYLRDMLVKPLFLVIYALLIGAAVARSRKPEKFVTPLLISCWAMVGVVVGFTVSSGMSLSDLAGTYARHFFSAVGMHSNDLGRLNVVAYALLLFVWDRSSGITRKALILATMGAVVIALLLTFSRGAFLGFILVNILYLFTLFSRRNRKIMLLAVLVVPIALYFMPGAVMSRMEMGWGGDANDVSAGRVEDIWIPLAPEIFDNPVLGNGLGAVMWAKAMIRDQMFRVGHPHNAFLQLYLDMGIVGFLLIMGFWIHAWRTFRALARDARVAPALQGLFNGAAAGLVSFIVAGMAGSSFEPAPEQAFLWLAVGVMFGIQAKLAATAAPAPGLAQGQG